MKISLKHIFVSLVILSVFLPMVNFAYAEDDILRNLETAAGAANLQRTANLQLFIGRIIQFFLGFLGIIFVGMIIYGGFMYLTASGDSNKAGKAKNLIRDAIIGVIIVLAAYAIAYTVISQIQASMTSGGGTG
ncbi:MAG: hypothetical protein AAB358_00385 [Patescibacteria group bacterium]